MSGDVNSSRLRTGLEQEMDGVQSVGFLMN